MKNSTSNTASTPKTRSNKASKAVQTPVTPSLPEVETLPNGQQVIRFSNEEVTAGLSQTPEGRAIVAKARALDAKAKAKATKAKAPAHEDVTKMPTKEFKAMSKAVHAHLKADGPDVTRGLAPVLAEKYNVNPLLMASYIEARIEATMPAPVPQEETPAEAGPAPVLAEVAPEEPVVAPVPEEETPVTPVAAAIAKHKAEALAQKELEGVSKPVAHKSLVESPVQLVWRIAGAMPGARRKDVINAALEAGVAFYTARTQYQAWFTANKKPSKV